MRERLVIELAGKTKPGKQQQRTVLANEARAVHGRSDPLDKVNVDGVQLELADALARYDCWATPTVIISDGPYGLGLFPGDPLTTEGLVEAYEPHVEAWSRRAVGETTLWFWCNEIGWALVHPLLARYGWIFRNAHIWDKGIAHIAGNVNSKTIRKFPIVTEICVQYVFDVKLPTCDGKRLSLQEWLRHEWVRSGLPLSKTNEACGVKNAATRKYFTADHLWYFPPPEMIERLVAYANEHGKPGGKPYFSADGVNPIARKEWERMRAKWNHTHGVTNVWAHPAIHGTEREKDSDAKTLHANQKPLALMKRIIEASSDPDDVVWEPFGGLCTGMVAAMKTGRRGFAAEVVPTYFALAKKRLERVARAPFMQLSLMEDRSSADALEDEMALSG